MFLTSFCITLQGSLPVAFALSVPNVPTPRGVVPTHHVTPQGIYIGSLPSHLGHHDLSCDKVWQVSLVVCDCRFNCKFVLLPFSKFASSLLLLSQWDFALAFHFSKFTLVFGKTRSLAS